MPVVRDTKHWFIQLMTFEQLREWIAHKGIGRKRPQLCNLLDQGLERSITRDLSWGIPVPC